MADIIDSNREPEPRKVNTHYPVWEVALLAVFLGIIYWLLTSILTNFVFDSLILSGDVALIIVAKIGLVMMMRLSMARPLMVAVASVASLWGLAGWTNGFTWSQIILWNIVIYLFSFVLFSWLARYNKTIVAMFMMLFVIVVIRIIVIL